MPNERLARELLATTYSLNGRGQIVLTPKTEIRARLGGQSPDDADAVSMCFEPTVTAWTTTYHV